MLRITFNEPVVLDLQQSKMLTDSALAARIEHLAKHEAEVSLAFLLDLMEVSKRGLHIDAGFPSLFSFLTEKLKLPKGSAYLRIQSMKALRDFPEHQDNLREGRVSLSSLAKVQTFIEKSEKTKREREKIKEEVEVKVSPIPIGHTYAHQWDSSFDYQQNIQFENSLDNQFNNRIDENPIHEKAILETKRTLFEQIVGKSSRETEALIANLGHTLSGDSPDSPKLVEKEKELSHGHRQISFVADPELVAMLQRLKEVVSHQSVPSASYLELLKKACSIALLKLDPLEKAKRAKVRKEKKTILANPAVAVKPESCQAQNLNSVSSEKSTQHIKSPQFTRAMQFTKPSPRYIPAEKNHEVWLRGQGMCQRLDPSTGKICGSRLRVQRQHMIPLGKGGDHSQLDLYCQSCNLKAAVSDFGAKLMKVYLTPQWPEK